VSNELVLVMNKKILTMHLLIISIQILVFIYLYYSNQGEPWLLLGVIISYAIAISIKLLNEKKM
jgi:hypothetical protein